MGEFKINKRSFIKIISAYLALSGCGAGNEMPSTNRKTVGMWVLLLWFNDSSVNFYPWDQYVRLKPAFGRYFSLSKDWINYTLDAAVSMGVDYLILDNTNGVFRHNGIFDKSIDEFFNAISNRKLNIKISIATGYEVYEKKDWLLFLKSIDHLRQYFERPEYFKVEGKPLLTLYINKDDSLARMLEGAGVKNIDATYFMKSNDLYGFKNYLTDISIRYASGGAGWIEDVDGVYGWRFDYPQKMNRSSMGVMPGWDRSHNELTGSAPVERDDGYYYEKSWQRVIKANPNNVVITSWDDWAEETAIAPEQGWGDYYFNTTKKYILQYKNKPLFVDASSSTKCNFD